MYDLNWPFLFVLRVFLAVTNSCFDLFSNMALHSRSFWMASCVVASVGTGAAFFFFLSFTMSLARIHNLLVLALLMFQYDIFWSFTFIAVGNAGCSLAQRISSGDRHNGPSTQFITEKVQKYPGLCNDASLKPVLTQSIYCPGSENFAHPVNTRLWANIGSMLVQRRRRWAKIRPTIAQCSVFAGRSPSRQTRKVDAVVVLMFGLCRRRWTKFSIGSTVIRLSWLYIKLID